jgi:hypothetical protein
LSSLDKPYLFFFLRPYIPCCENDNNNYISNDFYILLWLQYQTRFGLRRLSSVVH